MRSLIIGLALSCASGCIPLGAPPDQVPANLVGSPATWWLVLDDAELGRSRGDGSPPDVFVQTTVNGALATSGTDPGTFHPLWDEPLLEADAGSYESGIGIDVWASDSTGTWLAGSVLITPTPQEVEGGGLILDPFGDVTALRLHFQPPQ